MVTDPVRGIFDTFDELQRLRLRVLDLRRESDVLRARAVQHELLLIERTLDAAAGELVQWMAGPNLSN